MSGGNHHLRWVYQGCQESFRRLPITNTNDNMHWRMFRQKKNTSGRNRLITSRMKSITDSSCEKAGRFVISRIYNFI
ncbi:hypothetical protein HanIR_Chr09g0396761 [Helianthus annuus]|nr:hypothetical protein HanIR_Chr09g0396761 [Helianthus annuus]